MGRRYIPSVNGRGVVRINEPSVQASRPVIQSLLNHPHQAMPTVQPPPQNYAIGVETLPVLELAAQLATMQTVQTISVKQPANQIAAPLRSWNRLNWQMPYITGRMDRYPMVGLVAPNRIQSIPGYMVSQIQATGSNVNALQATQYQNLRAPSLNSNGTCS
jgi:hypothetical protein